MSSHRRRSHALNLALARTLERQHPGTRWVPCDPDEPGAVRLIDPDKLDAIRQRLVRRYGPSYIDAIQRALEP